MIIAAPCIVVVVPVSRAAVLGPAVGDLARLARLRGEPDPVLERLAEECDTARRACLAGRLPMPADASTGARSPAHTVTVTEYVKVKGGSRRTVTDRCRTGALDAVLVGGKWWIHQRELEGVSNGNA